MTTCKATRVTPSKKNPESRNLSRIKIAEINPIYITGDKYFSVLLFDKKECIFWKYVMLCYKCIDILKHVVCTYIHILIIYFAQYIHILKMHSINSHFLPVH